MDSLKEKYDKVCFSLSQKDEELKQLQLDLFVLNPRVQELVKEIYDLRKEKEDLEEVLNG